MDKQKKKKVLFIGLGTAAAGVLGFFGWEWWKGKKDKKQQEEIAANAGRSQGNAGGSNSENTKSHYSSNAPSSSGSSDFPLHKGSRGAKVKAFQQALISKYGASILPRYGADGDFGNEMAAALKKEGLPSTIDEATYYSIVGGGSSNNNAGNTTNNSLDPTTTANNLFKAVQAPDFTSTLTILKTINDTTQYAAVDAVYKTIPSTWYDGGKKTIVTGVLDAFTDSSQQQQITSEFTRMGLKNNNGKWTLSGLEQHPLVVTDEDTDVFEKDGTKHSVPVKTTLGYPFAIKEGWVYFYSINGSVLMKVKQDTVTIQNLNN